jgi:hypothetical protein
MTQRMSGRVPAELIASEQGSVLLSVLDTQAPSIAQELGFYSPQAYIDETANVCGYPRAACHVTMDLSIDWNVDHRVQVFLIGQASGVDSVVDQWGWPADPQFAPLAARFMDTMPILRTPRQLVGGALRARYCPAESYRIRVVFEDRNEVRPVNITVKVTFGFVASRG